MKEISALIDKYEESLIYLPNQCHKSLLLHQSLSLALYVRQYFLLVLSIYTPLLHGFLYVLLHFVFFSSYLFGFSNFYYSYVVV